MKYRIFWSIFCVSLAVMLLSCGAMIYLAQNTVKDNSLKSLTSFVKSLATSINTEGINIVKSNIKFPYRVTLIKQDGSVYFDNEADPLQMGNHLERKEIKEAIKQGYGSDVRISNTLSERTDYYAIKLENGQVLRCSVTAATLFQGIVTLLSETVVILLFAGLVSLYLAVHLAKRIVSPLNELDLDHPLDSEIYDELTPLVKRLDSQQKHINKQILHIKRQREELSAVTASMTEGLVILNSKGEIISINHSARKLLHADASAVGKSFLNLDHSSYVFELFDGDNHDFYAKRTSIERDGQIYDIFISRVGNEELLGYALIYVNVTASRLAEAQRREFTANVSHELKTPLQSIIGAAELLESGLVRRGDEQSFYKKISREATALVRMINDIILLSRLDEGKVKETSEILDPLNICNEISKNLHDKAQNKNISINIHGSLTKFTGNYRYFYEMIFNLTDNAIKYGKEYGHVNIELQEENGNKIIMVEDDGLGISQEDQQRIFERFYRVDKSHSRRNEGTGLGLSIVKRAAKFFGGDVSVKSQIGKGTCFKVVIPASKQNI